MTFSLCDSYDIIAVRLQRNLQRNFQKEDSRIQGLKDSRESP
jgi:hypothetical protein